MGFDPDAYLKQKASENSGGGFDPDAYLASKSAGPSMTESALRGAAQGATFGFADELAGAGEGLWDVATSDMTLADLPDLYSKHRDESRANFKAAEKANPKTYLAGELGGGLASAVVPIGAGANTLRAATKTGITLGGLGGLGHNEDPNQIAADVLNGAGIGGLFAAGGYGVAKGLGKLGNLGKEIGDATVINPEINAAEVEAAAGRLGVKPTPGMVKNSKVVQGLESSLSQSPSLAGRRVRATVDPVLKAVDDVPKELLKDATSLSPFEVGEKVKAGIGKTVSDRAAKSSDVFKELAESTRNIPVSESSLNRVSRNIQNIDDVALTPGSSWANKAQQYSEWLKNAKSVDQIKRLRQLVGKDLETAEGPEKLVLGSIYERMTRLEENSLMRGAIDTMRGFAQKPTGKTGDALAAEGENIGAGMLAQMRGAKKDYHGLMNDLRGISENARLGRVGNPGQFTDSIDSIASEKIGDKLFNVGDERLMRSVKSQFPAEADLLRQAKLADIAKRSSAMTGEISNPKFLNNVRGLNPEAQNMLFGENVGKIKDMQTVIGSLPDKIGPSGTPQGEMYRSMWNPIFQAQEGVRYGAYKALSTDTAAKISQFLARSPRMQRLAEENPQAFKAMVIDISQRFKPPQTQMPRAAENELDRDSSTPSRYPIDPDEAKRQFLEGN